MTMGSGLVRNFTQLFLARMGIGVGEASLTPAALSLISDRFPPEKRTSPIGFYNSAIYIGAGLAMVLGGAVIKIISNAPPIDLPFVGELVPWQATFLVVGAPGLLVAAMIAFTREPTRKESLKKDGGEIVELSYRDVAAYIWKNRQLYGPLFVGMAVVATVNTIITVNIVSSMLRVTPNQMRGLAYALLLMVMTVTGTALGPTMVAIITDYVFENELMIGYSMMIASLATAFFSNIAFYKCISAFRLAINGLAR
jgi:MFS family permease